MNKDLNFLVLYYRYKDTPYYTLAVIAIVFFISMILLFQLIIPQIESWFSIRSEIIATSERIDTINKNIEFMKNINKTNVDKQVSVVTETLPFEKDFGSILNALNDASTVAGVSLSDYSFQVGNIASTSGQKSTMEKDFSSVRITVTVSGGISAVSAFLNEINKRVPLSEVMEIDGDSFTTTITLQFYQKQFPKIAFRDDRPIVSISAKDESLLNELSSWKPQSQAALPQDVSSTSGVPLFN